MDTPHTPDERIDHPANERRMHQVRMERAQWAFQPMNEQQRLGELFKFMARNQRSAAFGLYLAQNADPTSTESDEILRQVGDGISKDFEETFGVPAPWRKSP